MRADRRNQLKILDKYQFVRQVITPEGGNKPTLLDVGCRKCELRGYVHDIVDYYGVDMFQNAEGTVDFVLDVESGLPMEDGSYDYVVALDLLEHLDNFEGALDELLRVARRCLIIMLPNLAHGFFRKEFLLRGRLGAKYDMRYGMGLDRHRWLPVLSQTDEYMSQFAKSKDLQLETRWYYHSKKKRLFAAVLKFLGFSPSWWVWASLYVIRKER